MRSVQSLISFLEYQICGVKDPAFVAAPRLHLDLPPCASEAAETAGAARASWATAAFPALDLGITLRLRVRNHGIVVSLLYHAVSASNSCNVLLLESARACRWSAEVTTRRLGATLLLQQICVCFLPPLLRLSDSRPSQLNFSTANQHFEFIGILGVYAFRNKSTSPPQLWLLHWLDGLQDYYAILVFFHVVSD
ncbi:hypothetical protein EJB05_47213 [Eragrostis curvula]|uniref:Uncharacterized protein n=1 Tax=Eragrostis curvula TaxID=38414 RepID=A0A5J9T6X8_9POAL|nr:hypothetical protein EJB05_47213 [Eragrostis curvula]